MVSLRYADIDETGITDEGIKLLRGLNILDDPKPEAAYLHTVKEGRNICTFKKKYFRIYTFYCIVCRGV